MATQSDNFGLGATRIAIPAGATNAFLVTPLPYGVNQMFKYFSGGSVEIIHAPGSSALTGAQLVAAGSSGGYLLSTQEIVNIDGPARYYLMATGSTAVVMQCYGLSSGYEG